MKPPHPQATAEIVEFVYASSYENVIDPSQLYHRKPSQPLSDVSKNWKGILFPAEELLRVPFWQKNSHNCLSQVAASSQCIVYQPFSIIILLTTGILGQWLWLTKEKEAVNDPVFITTGIWKLIRNSSHLFISLPLACQLHEPFVYDLLNLKLTSVMDVKGPTSPRPNTYLH